MQQLLFAIIITLTLYGCTHPQVDTSQDNLPTKLSTDKSSPEDSIDKRGYLDCRRPFDSTVQKLCLKSLDSLWTGLLQNNKTHQTVAHYSKDNFKDALINDGFAVNTSLNWTAATKRGFNERWRAEWNNDSNYVQLVVTRWYHGYTYAFFVGSDKFDK